MLLARQGSTFIVDAKWCVRGGFLVHKGFDFQIRRGEWLIYYVLVPTVCSCTLSVFA